MTQQERLVPNVTYLCQQEKFARPLENLFGCLERHLDTALHESLPFARITQLYPPVRKLLKDVLQNLLPRIGNKLDPGQVIVTLSHHIARTLHLARQQDFSAATKSYPHHPGFDSNNGHNQKLPFVNPVYPRELILRVLCILLPRQDANSSIMTSFLTDTILYAILAPLFHTLANPQNLNLVLYHIVRLTNETLDKAKKSNNNKSKGGDHNNNNNRVDDGNDNDNSAAANDIDVASVLIEILDPLLNVQSRPRLATLLTFVHLSSLVPFVNQPMNTFIMRNVQTNLLSESSLQDIVQLVIDLLDNKPGPQLPYPPNVMLQQELNTFLTSNIHPSFLSFFFHDLSFSSSLDRPDIAKSLSLELVSLLNDHALNVHLLLHVLDSFLYLLFPELSQS